MHVNAARLLPHEIERRRAAFSRAFENLPVMADTSPMAGASSAPVAAIPPVGCLTLPPAETPAVFSPGVVCVVDYETARKWAIEQGLCKFRKALDLTAVNATRRKMRLAPFALKWGE